jgi:GT2 family glycosyltransferase
MDLLMYKKHFDCVFVLLVYANTDDVKDYIKSFEKYEFSRKYIIVNSYYDDKSMRAAADVAQQYGCDFINVENKGYGAGNNRGIEHALTNYDFNYLIVSNTDMEVVDFDYDYLNSLKYGVVGPKIITSTGKNQNPFYVDKKPGPLMPCSSARKTGCAGRPSRASPPR